MAMWTIPNSTTDQHAGTPALDTETSSTAAVSCTAKVCAIDCVCLNLHTCKHVKLFRWKQAHTLSSNVNTSGIDLLRRNSTRTLPSSETLHHLLFFNGMELDLKNMLLSNYFTPTMKNRLSLERQKISPIYKTQHISDIHRLNSISYAFIAILGFFIVGN